MGWWQRAGVCCRWKWIPGFSLQIGFISHLTTIHCAPITIHTHYIRFHFKFTEKANKQKPLYLDMRWRWRWRLFLYNQNIVCTIFYYEKSNWVKEHVRHVVYVCCNRIFIFIAAKAITNFGFSSIIYRKTISISGQCCEISCVRWKEIDGVRKKLTLVLFIFRFLPSIIKMVTVAVLLLLLVVVPKPRKIISFDIF